MLDAVLGRRVTRTRLYTILGLGLPIIGGMVSQNILNLVDMAMVGTLGDAALAGVGLGSFMNFMGHSIVIGLGVGVQAVVARRFGEGAKDATLTALYAGLILALLISIPVMSLLFTIAPRLFPLLIDDPAVISEGAPYMQVRFLGMAAVGMNFAFRGFWNGINLSIIYLRTIVLMHSVNIALNYVLIFGALGAPALGSLGAGIGTAVSTYVGSAYYALLVWRFVRRRELRPPPPSRALLARVTRLSLPNSVQKFVFAAGLTALFWILGQIGTREVAAGNVLMNVMLVAILPALGLGLAATSLVGQALGRGEPDDAARWGWDVAIVGVVVLFLLGLPMVVFPELILSTFLHDSDTLALASTPLRILALFIAIDGVGLILQSALLGAGATRLVMLVSGGLQWLLFLPLAFWIGPVAGYGLVGIYVLQVVYRLLQALIYAWLWRGRGWTQIRV